MLFIDSVQQRQGSFFKTFDEILKGMKKNGHRIAMIATNLYSIEVVRVRET